MPKTTEREKSWWSEAIHVDKRLESPAGSQNTRRPADSHQPLLLRWRGKKPLLPWEDSVFASLARSRRFASCISPPAPAGNGPLLHAGGAKLFSPQASCAPSLCSRVHRVQLRFGQELGAPDSSTGAEMLLAAVRAFPRQSQSRRSARPLLGHGSLLLAGCRGKGFASDNKRHSWRVAGRCGAAVKVQAKCVSTVKSKPNGFTFILKS